MNLRLVVLVVAGVVVVGLVAGVDPGQAAPRTNVVLMTADNLGFHDTGCYGNREVRTPNIDRLAGQGVRCTSFYSASPTCTVSRASLLTGRYPQRHGLMHQLRTSADLSLDENLGVGLRHSEVLLPELLKPRGYATACFGKWNIGFAPGSRPTERGFDEFFGHASGNMDYYTHVYKGRNDLYRATEPANVEGYSTDLFAEAACDFLRRKAKGPFFLYLPFNAVHYPGALNKKPGEPCIWQAPDESFAKYGYAPDTLDVGERYQATVTALDAGIGRVLGQINALGLRENTLVIFFSDNGAFAAQMNCASNEPYRTERAMIYEGSIRVCCLVRWPGRITPKTVCDETLVSLDFFPMILDAANAPAPGDLTLDGRDPTAALAGRAASPHQSLFWQYNRNSAVRRGRHKLVKPRTGKSWELYDLADDPGETKNLAQEKPELAAELEREFEQWSAAVKE
ncbi:MAG: sulfatase-like hydrolase/transferase [Planctomycetota bacterium]